ncbi:SRPBCC family protein [Pseudonocardia sp. DLS-67]
MSQERLEASRIIDAPASEIFRILRDPKGHVAIDASGMLQDATGEAVTGTGDTFVVHMDREALGDRPEMGRYDVTVTIRSFVPDAEISWTILGTIRPQIGHYYGYRLAPADSDDPAGATLVTSYYDWSEIDERYRGRLQFPVIDPGSLRATLGILDRTVRRRRSG